MREINQCPNCLCVYEPNKDGCPYCKYIKQIDETLQLIKDELIRANNKFPGTFNSTHEGYAVIKEELDEMWDDIKGNLPSRSCVEAIQVGAMTVKYIISIRG